MSKVTKLKQKQLRTTRNTSRIHGTSERPRLSITISNKNMHAQVINDDDSKTIYGATFKKTESAKVISEVVKAAKAAKVKKLVLDRRDRRYHGKLAEIADGIRKEGMEL